MEFAVSDEREKARREREELLKIAPYGRWILEWEKNWKELRYTWPPQDKSSGSEDLEDEPKG